MKSAWIVVLVLSLLFVVYDIMTFNSAGNATDVAKAFDTGQVLGIVFWVAIAVFAGFKLNKMFRNK